MLTSFVPFCDGIHVGIVHSGFSRGSWIAVFTAVVTWGGGGDIFTDKG